MIYVKHPDDGMIKSIETPWKPELLEVCEQAARAIELDEPCEDGCVVCEAYKVLRAAIAKANGDNTAK